MGKTFELIKRGMIVGLAVTTISGTILPKNIAYADIVDNETASIEDIQHIGSTGHITSIKDDVRDWEYKAPEYIITELELPLNYVNPWYTNDTDADPAKNVKTYYYLGTVIYNDTTTKGTASGYDSLSAAEKQNYDDIKYSYDQKKKNSSAYNAKKEIVKKGIEYDSTDLPLIYQLLTGEKFDWLYWYNEGIEGAKDYSSYKVSSGSSSKISHGKESNYATKVTVSSSKEGIAQIYKIVKDGEARVYVKGLKKGTTTLTIKTTLNDGKTVSYKTKVTIKDAASPIKYKTDVNPLSYAAYALKQDGGNWLGYLSKFGEFYSKDSSNGGTKITNQAGDVDVVSVYAHPTLDSTASFFTGGKKFYKKKLADTSSYMNDFLKKAGAFDMLARGESEYKIFKAVQKAISDTRSSNIDNDKLPQRNKSAYHYTLKGFLEGRVMACEDHVAITQGICEMLGFNYYTKGIKNDVLTIVVLDGKQYTAKATTMSEFKEATNPMTLTLPKLTYSYKSLADVPLSDLVSGKYILNIKGTDANGAGLFYKVSDKYEAGRFKYGAEVAPANGSSGTTKINDSYGVLEADKGDIRLLTLRAGLDPAWDNKEQNTVTFRYAVPYMEKAYFKISKGSTKQLQLVNSDWSEWTIKTSDSKIATVNSTGKVTMKGTGTATITLTHKTMSGLSIKVMVSTSTIKEATAKTKAGTFYSKNDGMYTNGTNNIIAGNYMRIHD